LKYVNPGAVARGAMAPSAARPASAIVHDSPDARLVVFRLEPGQVVSPHHSASTVVLTVIAGSGNLGGADGDSRSCVQGDTVIYEPNEVHWMSSAEETLVILAMITPRPGSR
jgi:quercetin dioxygenase-like cupin family protein